MPHVTVPGVLAALLGTVTPVVALAVAPRLPTPAPAPTAATRAWEGSGPAVPHSARGPSPSEVGTDSSTVAADGQPRTPTDAPRSPRTGSAPSATSAGPPGRWGWPLRPQPHLVHPFEPPASPYGPGHRGVDLAARPGQDVLAVEGGRVAHVGQVAGRGSVTVVHATGLRSTYEPVSASVSVGEVVARGTPLGTVESVDGHCTPATCLHLGALTVDGYLDPLRLILRPRVVLLPVD